MLLSHETQNDIDILYEKVCTAIIDEMNENIVYKDITVGKKVRRKYKPDKPFWDDDLRLLWETMHEKEKQWCRYKGENKHTKQKFKIDFIYARKCFDKHLRLLERRYNRGLLVELDEVCTSNPTLFWNQLKNIGPKQSSKIPEEVMTGETLITDQDTVLQSWRDDFSSLYNIPPESRNFDETHKNYCCASKEQMESNMLDPLYIPNQVLNKNFTFEEVKFHVTKSKNKKATGVDNIPYEVLKNDHVIAVLLQFFQLCFDCGKIPNTWRKAIIQPIPKDKKNDKRIPLNYRGISLLCTILKIYTSLLNKRLMTYLDELGISVDEQCGFRPKRSCNDQIYSLTSVIRNRLAQKLGTFCTFIDFKKAFDFIHRDLLFYKLLLNNVNGNFYNIIKSMYTDTEACIRLNSLLTPWFNTTSGVKQGDCLSTTLFSLYINDLVHEINALNLGVDIDSENISILLYADDLVLVANTEADMNSMLEAVNKFCVKWRLTVNSEKSNVMHFRRKDQPVSTVDMILGGTKLNYVTDYKYLGVVLNEHLDFTETAKILAEAAGRALGSVCNKFNFMKNMNIKTYNKMINAYVKPVMHYSACVWGFKDFSKSNQVLHKAARFYLGVHKFTPVIAMFGELEWLPSVNERWIDMLRWWNHLVNLENDRLLKKCFNYDYLKCKNNWCSEIKSIFTKLDMLSNYENKKSCNLNQCKLILSNTYSSQWYAKVNNVPKLRTYVTFKEKFELEEYIKVGLSRKQRSVLAQLRLGILPLHVETGRFVNTKVHDRLCLICKNSEIEDERHFVLHCAKYESIRNKWLGNIIDKIDKYAELDDISKFKEIMSKGFIKLSSFIIEALEIRKNIISDLS